VRFVCNGCGRSFWPKLPWQKQIHDADSEPTFAGSR